MSALNTFGKFLDQPILVAKFNKAVPLLLAGGACAYVAQDSLKADESERKKRAVKTGVTLGVTVASALAAPHIASKLTKRPLSHSLSTIVESNKDLVDKFVKNSKLDEQTVGILNKSKNKILKFSEVKTIFEKLKNVENGKEFLEKLIPSPQNVSAKDIFSEIGYLSIYGVIPVIGGISGGIAADKITDSENWKKKVPDKIKEGSYQYLANIFMCNVGAGIALGILEKIGIQSKIGRALGITLGIVISGIIGGSKIANLIGDKLIDPLCNKMKKNTNDKDIFDIDFTKKQNYYDVYNFTSVKNDKKVVERTPELLDIGLHTDDIATVSLLSGLKWIEPALPIMYTLSGYRAGIGYRN